MGDPRAEFLAVVESVYRSIKRSERDVRMDDRIREDLGVDSLTAVELLAELEQRLDRSLLDDPRVTEVRTVGDLYGLVATP